MVEADPKPIAELRGVSKIYGSGDLAVKALDQLDLVIREGDYLAVMGASGSGKSTAMNILGCLDRPTQGSYRLNDMAIDQLDDDALAEVRNRSLGFVFQQFHLLPNATAMDNVMLPMIYAGIEPEERRARARSALERVGLGQRLDNRPNQLSGGQQQRVAIARSVANAPRVLLADEPTGNLDPDTAKDVFHHLSMITRATGTAALVVTHNQQLALKMDSILTIIDGKIISIG